MKYISARDYDVFKNPERDFEKTPSGDDFFISDDGENFSWSTDGETIGTGLPSITRATVAIKNWAAVNDKTGSVWLLDGDTRKYVGKIN